MKNLEFTGKDQIAVLRNYTEWRNFTNSIIKAKTACEVSGHKIQDHFVDVNKMVDLGSGSRREIAYEID